jgi:hypothetical protein
MHTGPFATGHAQCIVTTLFGYSSPFQGAFGHAHDKFEYALDMGLQIYGAFVGLPLE